MLSPKPAPGVADSVPQPRPTVSVVVPCYNQGRFLSEAVDSLLAQERECPEIIVVDDGSTDDTAAIAAGYGDRVRLLRQPNRGLAAARNAGLAIARGRFVAFLDADDAWEPGFLRGTLPVLDDAHVVAVYTRAWLVDSEGRRARLGGSVVEPERFSRQLLRGGFLLVSATVLRTEIVRRLGGFDERLLAQEDRDLWMRLCVHGEFRGVSTPLVRYRIHPGSMSHDPDHMHRMRMALLEKHFGPPAGDADSWPLEKRRAYALTYRQSALGYLETGAPDRSIDLMHAAVRCWSEILVDLDTHYELACAEQPRTVRGNAHLLDLEARAARLGETLDALLANAAPAVRQRGRPIRGHAWLALGMLADEAGSAGLAGRWLLRAAWMAPRAAFRQRVPRRLLRLALEIPPGGRGRRPAADGDR